MVQRIRTVVFTLLLLFGLLPLQALAQGTTPTNSTLYLPLSFSTQSAQVSDLSEDDGEWEVEDWEIEGYSESDEPSVEAASWWWWGSYHRNQGSIVVANRASGTISVIDVATDEVTQTITLPGLSPQPMYVNYSKASRQVFVGDRTNNQVVVYDANDFSLVGTIPAGAGIFHMWANLRGKQLWVNNDIDNTITVIDTRSNTVLNTIDLPADLVDSGWKPHDVVISESGRNVFVSMINLAGDNDYVLKYNARTFEETARAAVGKDPHVSVSRRGGLVYVASQGSSEVAVLWQYNLSLKETIPVEAAHGLGMRTDARYLYTTNISGGGPGGLVTIDINRWNANTVIGTTDTPFAVPHNIAVTNNGRKVYVTHSGPVSNRVSVYSASRYAPVPVLVGTVVVEFNPFGLDFVP